MLNNGVHSYSVATFANLPDPRNQRDGCLGFTDDGGSYHVRRGVWVPDGGTSFQPLINTLDFRTGYTAGGVPAASLPTGMTWTRGGGIATTVQADEGRYIDVSGVNDNQARYGRRLAWHPNGFLMERESRNLVPNSENYAAATWAATGIVTPTPTQPGPNGTNNASAIVCASGAFLVETVPSSTGNMTCSQWVSNGTPNFSVSATVAGRTAIAGTVAAGIFRRPTLTKVIGAEVSAMTCVDGRDQAAAGGVTGAGIRTYTGTGCQREPLLICTSLIPTSGAAVIRPFDVCTVSGTPTWFDDDGSLTLAIQFCPLAAIASYVGENGGTTSNIIIFDASNSNRVIMRTNDVPNVAVAVIANGVNVTSTGFITWGATDVVTLFISTSPTKATLLWYSINDGPLIPITMPGTPQTWAATLTASLMGNGSARVNAFINYVLPYPKEQRDVWINS